MESSGKQAGRETPGVEISKWTSRDWESPGVKSKEKHRPGVAGGLSSMAYTLRGVMGVSNCHSLAYAFQTQIMSYKS